MFLSCGLDLWGNKLWHKDILTKKRSLHKIIALVCWISISIPVARFFVALPLLSVANTLRKPGQSISWKNRMAVSWAGCARGAVTLALTVNHFLSSSGDGEKDTKLVEENRIIAAAAMVVIVLSTVVLGGATPAIFTRLLRNSYTEGSSNISSSSGRDEKKRVGYGNQQSNPSSSLTAPLLGGATRTTAAAAAVVVSPHQPTAPRHVSLSPRHPATVITNHTNPNRIREKENDEQEDVLGSSLHAKWTALDKKVFQPLFGGRSMRRDTHDDVAIQYRTEEDSPIHRLNGTLNARIGRVPSPFESTQARQRDLETGTTTAAAAPAPAALPSRRLSNASFGRVDNDVLEELFTQPGRSRRGPALDEEVEADGCLQEAEDYLEK
jgi:hypothetical protein